MYIQLEIFPEDCCDYCQETIHNHFHCPTCGEEYAGTDIYGSLGDEEVGCTLACEECKAVYQLESKNDTYDWNEWSWILIRDSEGNLIKKIVDKS